MQLSFRLGVIFILLAAAAWGLGRRWPASFISIL